MSWTPQQAEWMRAHRNWEGVGKGHLYLRRAMLHEDGTMDEYRMGERAVVRPGSREIGIRNNEPRGPTR